MNRSKLDTPQLLKSQMSHFVLYSHRHQKSKSNWLQPVSSSRLVFRLRRYDHITDALAVLHWLRVPQRVDFKIAVMAFRVLHGLAPPYLDQLVRVADLPGRRTRSLRSSTSLQLDIPAYRLESIGRRSFPVAASTLWNTLPSEIQSSPSLTLFRQRLKTYLIQKSFPDVLLWWLRLRGPRNNICYSGHVKYFSDWLIDFSDVTSMLVGNF